MLIFSGLSNFSICDVQVGILISLGGLNPGQCEDRILELHSVALVTNTVNIP